MVELRSAGGRHHFLRNKRQEWNEYRRQVTSFERERYLPVL
jgi:glutamine synthetase